MDTPPPPELPRRPDIVTLVVGLGYVAAALLLLGATCCLNEGYRGAASYSGPGVPDVVYMAMNRSFEVDGLLMVGIGLLVLLLSLSLGRGHRWAYLASVSVVGLLEAGFLSLAYASFTNDDPGRSPGDMNWMVWLPLAVLVALVLTLFLAPGVRRYFRRR